MATSLTNLIKVLQGMGKSENQIWKSIKKNPKFKSYTNKAITNAFDTVGKAYDVGKTFGSAKGKETIGSMSSKNGLSSTGTKTVTYSFHFAREGTGKGGKPLTSERVFDFQVPANKTKEEIKAMIREQIQDWLESEYGISEMGSISSNIRIKSIE